ncbi:MAG: Colicin V production protein [Marinobacter excellens HL-55]|uniref:Colicin V production protein n=1 Tax=Marinobacter excellens HL-55 TaxID=1305731 RepID=A0A0P7Z4E2_9GAMM|nr:MAG: Colicin V production protein [Marinobacter excellens HL-55]
MTMAEKLCLSAAFLFFMTGLLTGIWKYWCMATSAKAVAPKYVDVAHRSSLMYSFAAVLLGWFAGYSVYPSWLNTLAAAAALGFFALAIRTYIIHGLLRDTSNQLRKPHKLGSTTLPPWLIHGFMVLMIVAEVGGSLVLGSGALMGAWQS